VFAAARTLALLPGSTSLLLFTVAHLGPSVTFTFSGYSASPTVRIMHTNSQAVMSRTPYTPNMGGLTILQTNVAQLMGATNSYTVRGTGGNESAAGIGYVGPAIVTVVGGSGAPLAFYIPDANGNLTLGGSAAADGTANLKVASAQIWCPPSQYTVNLVNGPTAQTNYVSIVAD
jgi:hypothetical protein